MKSGMKTLALWLILIVIFVILLNMSFTNAETKMAYSELISSVKAGEVSDVLISADGTKAEVTLTTTDVKKEVTIPSLESFMDKATEYVNEESKITITQEEESVLVELFSLLSPMIILVIFLLFWLLLMHPNQNANKSVSFGKSKARMINMAEAKEKVTFKDVAGVDEEKEESRNR